MKQLSFDIHYSLMDRFIHIFNGKANHQITDWILKGSKSKLWEIRSEWFCDDKNQFEWSINNANEPELQKEVMEAIYLVFAILGKESEEPEYKGISKIFNDIVRLSVIDEKQDITTYSRYSTCIRSADVSFLYILHKLGFLETKEYTHRINDHSEERFSSQLKGELPKIDNKGNLMDVTFHDVWRFFDNRIKKLEEIGNNDKYKKPYKQTRHIANTIKRLKDVRNEESHRAFYTDPEKYWNRLVYMLFDYITVMFYFMRYLKVQVKK